MRTLPFLIGRNHQWSGMWAAVLVIDRGEVVGPHAAGCRPCAQSARVALDLLRPIVFAFQRKWPGGLTPIITERWMLFGYRQE